MAKPKQTRVYRYDFRGYHNVAATASQLGGPWCKAVTASAGSPTVRGVNGGGIRLQMDSTVEIQNLCLYMGDVLPFTITEIIRYWAIVKAGQTFDSTSQVAWGFCSARNDAIDSLTEQASFRCIANNTVVVETDDGTNDNNDVATGLTLESSDWQRFEIEMAEGITTMEPPTASVGRTSNIRFFGGNTYGSKRRVASGTRFDMSNYTSGLQLFFQLQKTSDANADDFDILECGVEVELGEYA